MEELTLLNDSTDTLDAILSFHAGMGAEDAHAWTSMLVEMIEKWAFSRGFGFDFLHQEPDRDGMRSASIKVLGHCAYGLLKSEQGIHRLIRIPPGSKDGRRHLSLASIHVHPVDRIDSKIPSTSYPDCPVCTDGSKEVVGNVQLTQIRSYTLDPIKSVRDHRTNFQTAEADKVLSGDLDVLIQRYLQWTTK